MKIDEVIFNLIRIRDSASDGRIYLMVNDCIDDLSDLELVIMREGKQDE